MDPNAGSQARGAHATDTPKTVDHAEPGPRLSLLPRRTASSQRETILAWPGKT